MEKKKKSAKRNIRFAAESLGRTMEIPPGTFGNTARIVMTGNREAVIDGCRGILEYSDSVIRINIGNMAMKFTGRSLEIKSLTADQAVITGYIVGIDFGS